MTATAPAPAPGRIDRARLDAASFPDTISMPVRFDDLDVLWHVNNAAAVIMLQEARVLFSINLALPGLHDIGLRSVVVAMNVEYAAEINHPGPVEISSGPAAARHLIVHVRTSHPPERGRLRLRHGNPRCHR